MIQTNLLFGIPIYKVHIDPLSYNKKDLIKVIESNYEISDKRNKYDDSNLHHSYNDPDDKRFKSISYKEYGLIDIYNNIFDDFCNSTLKTTEKFSYNYEVVNYTATKQNQFMRVHQHLPIFDFAIVHYLQLDKKVTRQTVLYNHNDFASYIKYVRPDFYEIASNTNYVNSYLYEFYKIDVKEDEMVIFPSLLKHEIPNDKEECKKLRITIVSNLKITKQK